MIYFPAELKAQRVGATYKPVSPTKTTKMQNGRNLVRKIFTNTPVFFDAEFIFSDEDAQLFERFYAKDTNNGLEWFTMNVLQPLGVKELLVRFSGAYAGPKIFGLPNAAERKWQYTATFEIYTRGQS